jgi:diadenylate cyclase
MYEEIRPLLDLFRDFSLKKAVAVADILLVAFLLYKLFTLIRGARASRILLGIAIFVATLFISKALQLQSLYWLLDKATLLGPVALVILLLPELRQAIEGFGRVGVWTQWFVNSKEAAHKIQATTIEELVGAVSELAARKIGALIVLERHSPMDDVIENGVQIGAKVSKPLLVSIFYGSNPLHDGAVVIRGDEIISAASRLPLSEARLDPTVHMRHRAAVGVAELYDCIPIVVSEERGTVSVVLEGRLKKLDEPSELRELLNKEWRQVKGGERTKLALFRSRTGTNG